MLGNELSEAISQCSGSLRGAGPAAVRISGARGPVGGARTIEPGPGGEHPPAVRILSPSKGLGQRAEFGEMVVRSAFAQEVAVSLLRLVDLGLPTTQHGRPA